MLREVILDRSLFDLLFSLDLVFMQVVGHSAVVLVRSRNGWLFNFLHLRMHLVYGLLHVRFHEVLLLSRGQFVDVDGFGDGALDLTTVNMLLMLKVLVTMRRCWSSLAALRVNYLLGCILGRSILNTVGSQVAPIDGRVSLLRQGLRWEWR